MESTSDGCEDRFFAWIYKEEVYVEQPLGFEVRDKDTNVRRLKKALYGLKQALLTGADPLIHQCKRELASEFKMKDLV